MVNLKALILASILFPLISAAPSSQEPLLVNAKTTKEKIVEKWQGLLGETDYLLRRQVFVQSQKNLEFLSSERVRYGLDGLKNFITLPVDGRERVIDFVDEFEEDSYQNSDRILYSDLNVGRNSKGIDYFNLVYPTIGELSENVTLYGSLDEASIHAEENKEQGFKNLEKMMLSFALEEALDFEADGISLSMAETKISFPSVKRTGKDEYYFVFGGILDITFHYKNGSFRK